MKILELLNEARAPKKPPNPPSHLTLSFKENNTKNGIVMMKSTPGQDPREFMTFYPGEGSNKVYAVMLKHLQENPASTVTLNIPKKPLAKKYETVFRGLIPYVNPKNLKDRANLPDIRAVLNQMGEYMTDRLTLNYDGDMSGIPRVMDVLRKGERPAPAQVSQAAIPSQAPAQLVEFVIEPWQWFSAIVKTNLFGMNDYLRRFNRIDVPDGKYVNRFVVTARDFERIKQRLSDVSFVARVQERLRGPNASPEDRRIPIVPKLVVVPSASGGIFEATGDEKFDSMLARIVRSNYTPADDPEQIERYSLLAHKLARHAEDLANNSTADSDDETFTKELHRYYKVMDLAAFYRMLAGEEAYDPNLAQTVQQRYGIDPRRGRPSL